MTGRDLQNKFVDGWLRVARLPFDVMAHLIPNGERGPRQGVTLAVDRADATIRAFAGAALGNDGLLLDANQRRAAADERARAIRLRTEAREQEVQADRRLDERRDEAERLRSRADRKATEREEQAEQKRRARKEKLRETTARQQQRVESERQRKHSAAEHEAKEQRVRTLDEKTDALNAQSDALTASDEAKRLEEAAANAKTDRKSNS